MPSPLTLSSLPTDLTLSILSHLPTPSLLLLSTSSTHFHSTTFSSPSLWHHLSLPAHPSPPPSSLSSLLLRTSPTTLHLTHFPTPAHLAALAATPLPRLTAISFTLCRGLSEHDYTAFADALARSGACAALREVRVVARQMVPRPALERMVRAVEGLERVECRVVHVDGGRVGGVERGGGWGGEVMVERKVVVRKEGGGVEVEFWKGQSMAERFVRVRV